MSFSINISGKFVSTTRTKTNCATIMSFPWSVLSSNKALDQSARKKLLSYCKIIFCCIIIAVVVVLQCTSLQFDRRGLNSTCFQYCFPAAIPGQLNFISFKNSLQECCQKQQLPVPAYKSWKFSYGYAAKVEVAGNTFKSTGVQGDQKEAQQNAAYNALVGLGLIDSTVPFDVKTAAGTLYIIFSL